MTWLAARPWIATYPRGVPTEIAPPETTLADELDRVVRRHGRRVALEFFGAETRYRELGDQVARAAEGLRRLGVGAGDRVALVLPNCPQHVVAFYAVLRLGAIVVEHNPLYTPRELRHQFEDHRATTAIVWDKVADAVLALPEDAAPGRVVAVDLTRAMPRRTRLALRLPLRRAREARAALTASPRRRGALPWERLVGHRPLRRSHPRPGLDDVAALQYTSGTTGPPKGAMLTHRNLRSNAEQGRAWVPGLKSGREVVYAVLPMFHAYGLTLCLSFALGLGARLVLFPRFDVDLVVAAARRHPPTFLPAVPPIYDRLADAVERGRVDLSRTRFAISGAMSLPPETVDRWERATGGLLVEGYGMTETSPVALGNPMSRTRRPGTVGVPFPSTEIRVVDPEHRDADDPRADVGPDEPGELLVRGPQVFAGYWNRPDETAAALTPDGWLRTGDIVTATREGVVRIVDRAKELIITGGFNVSPSEVEGVLDRHPDVVASAVVGVPSGRGDEEVAAAVVLRPGAELEAAALRAHCRTDLTPYKVPRRVVVVDELPTSLIGKVLRREVRDRLIAESAPRRGADAR